MKTKYARLLMFVALSSLTATSAIAASEAHAQILKERDGVLSQILKEQESRRATGHSVDDEIFSAQVALHSFRRDTAAAISDKLKNQQMIVSAHEKRLATMKRKSEIGAVANIEVLRVADGVLQAKQILEELRAHEKRG